MDEIRSRNFYAEPIAKPLNRTAMLEVKIRVRRRNLILMTTKALPAVLKQILALPMKTKMRKTPEQVATMKKIVPDMRTLKRKF